MRAPPIPSKTVSEIRNYLRKVQDERKEFLHKVGRRLMRQKVSDDSFLRVTALGGFREVGRSAALLMTRESKVLIDCGVAVSADDNGSTPYLNAPELQPLDSIDGVVVTHAHLDHCGLVPALFKYGYDGPVYCTAPTRDLMSLLQLDFIKVAVGEAKKPPYESSHMRETVMHCIPLKYGETTDISPDVRLTFQNAGHILGSAIAHFHVGDGLYNIAFTGDIKFEKSWLFNPAVNKFPRLETLVIESTYGGYHDMQPSRQEAANQLKEIVRATLGQGWQGAHPRLRGRQVPGAHARPRGADEEPPDPEGADIPGRHDLGGDGHPHRVSGVPQQPAQDPDIPDGREPVPVGHLQARGQRRDEGAHLPRPRALHRARDERHDERRAGHGVLQGLVRQPARARSCSSVTRARAPWAGSYRRAGTTSLSTTGGSP